MSLTARMLTASVVVFSAAALADSFVSQPVTIKDPTAARSANVVDAGGGLLGIVTVSPAGGGGSVAQSGTWTVQVPNGIFVDGGLVGAAQAGSWTVSATQGTAAAAANGWPVWLTDLTNLLGVTAHPVRTDPTGTTTQPVSAASLPLPSGAAQDSSVTGLQVSQGSTTSGQNGGMAMGAVTTSAPTYVTAKTSPLSLTTTGALRVDGSAVTQPVSLAANQSTNVAQFGGVNISTGTGASGTGIPRVTISNDSSLAANQSVNLAQVAGSAASTATAGVLLVGIEGRAGTSMETSAGALDVNIKNVGNTAQVTGGAAGSQAIGGTTATNTAITQNPVLVAVEANSAQPSAATTGRQRQLLGSLDGALYARPWGPIMWSCGLAAQGTTLAQCQAVPGAGLSLYISGILAQSTTTTAGLWTVTSGTGTNCATTNVAIFANSTAALFAAPANTAQPTYIHLSTPIKLPANTELCALGVVTNTTALTVWGFTAP